MNGPRIRSGSGPYILESNSVSEGIDLKRFEATTGAGKGTTSTRSFSASCRRCNPASTPGARRSGRGGDNLTFDAVDSDAQQSAISGRRVPLNRRVVGDHERAALLSKEVRQGLSYAFPYDDVLNVVYKGSDEAQRPDRRQVRGYDPDVFLYQTDLDKAKELILSGGFKEGRRLRVHGRRQRSRSSRHRSALPGQRAEDGLQSRAHFGRLRRRSNRPVFGDAPPEERPHIIGGWGWWPDYNDPWNQLAPNFTKATSAAAVPTQAPGSTSASRRSWPRPSTSSRRSNSTN